MNWQEFKASLLAFFEHLGQTCLYQQELELKPIPVETRPRPIRR